MKPIRLTMEAYGSYGKKTVVDFTTPNQNLFLVSGATGSGKTTIFDAVVFALYGGVSGSGGRGGLGLQSQYADSKVEPYVELVFSEGTGVGADGTVGPAIYRVRRSPQYKKVSRKLPVGESVSLYLPDGTEYPEKLKETNQKILEIVGLSREQFLQVGMIAQGEFMRMLRAGSDEKKEIFRKLFGTDVFRTVTEELKVRQDAARKALEQVLISLRSEAGQVRIPESLMNDTEGIPTEFAELDACIRRMQSTELPTVPDLEMLEKRLPELVGELSSKVSAEENSSGALDEKRDQTLAEYKQAEILEKQYQNMEQAAIAYRKLFDRRPAMEEKKTRQLQADAAWEIHTEWQRFFDLKEEVERDEKSLEDAIKSLPELKKEAAEAASTYKNAREEKEHAQDAFTVQQGKTQRAEDLFTDIQIVEGNLNKLETEEKMKSAAVKEAQTNLGDFEQQEKAWNQTLRDLGDAPAKKEQIEQQGKKVRELLDQKEELAEIEKKLSEAQAKFEQASCRYEQAAEQFRQKNVEYMARQDAYLGAQAGVLARDKLKVGMPCPVCGSLEHPNPCVLTDEDVLSREELDALWAVVSELNDKQSEASKHAGNCKTEVETQKENLKRETAHFLKEVKKLEIAGNDIAEMENRLVQMRKDLAKQYMEADREEKEFLAAKTSLEHAGEKKEKLQAARTTAEDDLQKVRQRIATEQGALQELLKKREYDNKEAAAEALEHAMQLLKSRSRNAEQLKAKADAAADALAKKETMQAHYETVLPGKRNECANRQQSYEKVRAQKNLEEAVWKQVIREVSRVELENLRNEVQNYREEYKEAQGKYKAAKQAVGENPRPDLAALQTAMVQAKEAADGAGKRLQLLQSDLCVDTKVAEEYRKLMKKRAQASERAVCMSGLYSRLAGKVTGARMDLETFVQRYYLERILHAANRRFLEMSSGEFELRMVPLDDAGSGRNKGLDLLVFSTVTGKEREVSTLSGGESFMAALSLALGMADQIQAASAGIHLDMMFIDEGFGSLDDYSREQAVRVLQRMAGGSRLIGIISHVTELKQEIEDQLLVTRDKEGSHIEWQIS